MLPSVRSVWVRVCVHNICEWQAPVVDIENWWSEKNDRQNTRHFRCLDRFFLPSCFYGQSKRLFRSYFHSRLFVVARHPTLTLGTRIFDQPEILLNYIAQCVSSFSILNETVLWRYFCISNMRARGHANSVCASWKGCLRRVSGPPYY